MNISRQVIEKFYSSWYYLKNVSCQLVVLIFSATIVGQTPISNESRKQNQSQKTKV